MELKQILLNDFKEAMKNKEVIKKQTVTMVRAAILSHEKNHKVVLDDAGIVDIIVSECKKRREALKEFEKAGREDLIEQTEKEIEVLMKYLPEQLSEEEVEAEVVAVIEQMNPAGIKDMGKVMAVLMPKLKGKADGSLISQLVKKHLTV
ncbi:MAG: GatB/YqeY domain-containing protein [Eubacteriaceae bacterium]|jgi:uncharacterized protein YqeY|nr:GatB/YqeY domain-containing protein [Eubacteriaceae bacterium]